MQRTNLYAAKPQKQVAVQNGLGPLKPMASLFKGRTTTYEEARAINAFCPY